jgi:hypothetical protein
MFRFDPNIYIPRAKALRIPLEGLPPSYPSWREYYYTQKRFIVGEGDHYDCITKLKVPKGHWQQFRTRMEANVGFSTQGYSNTFENIPHKNRRYIGVCDKEGKVYWQDHRLWCVSRKRYIKCIDLRTSSMLYRIQTGLIVHELIGNGKGMLAALCESSALIIWDVQKETSELILRKKLAHLPEVFNVFDDVFVCLDRYGDVFVWDLNDGALVGQIKLNFDLGYRIRHLVIKKYGDCYFFLEPASGNIHRYVERKSLPDANLPREYVPCGGIFSDQDGESPYIEDFVVLPHCVVTCGGGQVRVRRLASQEITKKKHYFDSYEGEWEQVPAFNPPKPTTAHSVLARNYSARRYGFRSNFFEGYTTPGVDLDGSSIYIWNFDHPQIVDSRLTECLSVWDFRVFRKHDRYFELVEIGDSYCFVIYDDISESIAEF